MSKKFVAVSLLCLAGGCRMCSNSCDLSPVVPGGPPVGTMRSGSNASSGVYGQPVPIPAVTDEYAAPSITPPPTEMLR